MSIVYWQVSEGAGTTDGWRKRPRNVPFHVLSQKIRRAPATATRNATACHFTIYDSFSLQYLVDKGAGVLVPSQSPNHK